MMGSFYQGFFICEITFSVVLVHCRFVFGFMRDRIFSHEDDFDVFMLDESLIHKGDWLVIKEEGDFHSAVCISFMLENRRVVRNRF